MQDAGAQLAAPLLDLRPGQRVLDACAAPGGKTAHILQQQPRVADLLAVDKDPSRLRRVEETLQRIGRGARCRVADLAEPGVLTGEGLFDRILVDNIAMPWLVDTFDLPEGFRTDPNYAALVRLASWACEQAKIELSSREETSIVLQESEIRLRDRSGEEIYLDIPIQRATLDNLISQRILETVESVRDTLAHAHLTIDDISRIVFIGGPSQYPPLRELVCDELKLKSDTNVDPMTAVAEGAAIFAESIDWSQEKRPRKSARGSLDSGAMDVTFDYIARTPDGSARIVAKCADAMPAGCAFQIDSLDTGWSSGRVELKQGASLSLALNKLGENVFKVFVFDPQGGPVTLPSDRIVITRTTAVVDGIPASHSICVAVRESLHGSGVKPRYLVRKGDNLPKKGAEAFRPTESLRANGPGG